MEITPNLKKYLERFTKLPIEVVASSRSMGSTILVHTPWGTEKIKEVETIPGLFSTHFRNKDSEDIRWEIERIERDVNDFLIDQWKELRKS